MPTALIAVRDGPLGQEAPTHSTFSSGLAAGDNSMPLFQGTAAAKTGLIGIVALV